MAGVMMFIRGPERESIEHFLRALETVYNLIPAKESIVKDGTPIVGGDQCCWAFAMFVIRDTKLYHEMVDLLREKEFWYEVDALYIDGVV